MKLSTIIDYIKTSPYNTNPVILQQLLQEYIDNPEPTPPTPPTPGDLTPFAVGQTITGIVINPSGMSVSELNSYLANLPTPPAQGSEHEGSDYLMAIGGSIDEEDGEPLNPDITIGYVDRVTTGEPSWGVNVLLIGSGSDVVYYSPQQINVEAEGKVIGTVPQGWSRMNSETGSFDVFTDEITLSFVSNTVTFVKSDFESINGKVFGAVIDEPTPSLTPLSIGQTITGYDFGDVNNGDTSATMDAFLAGLTYEGTDPTVIVDSSEAALLFATNFGEAYILAVDAEEPTIVYSSVSLSEQGIAQGFQNLTNGKYTLQSNIEVTGINLAEGWNGILVGAILTE